MFFVNVDREKREPHIHVAKNVQVSSLKTKIVLDSFKWDFYLNSKLIKLRETALCDLIFTALFSLLSLLLMLLLFFFSLSLYFQAEDNNNRCYNTMDKNK